MSSSETVKVMVRVRPMNGKERERGCENVIEVDQQQVILNKPNEKDMQKVFAFDSVFPTTVSQAQVYEDTAFQLIESVVEGYNGTILAYGQTGCGKTFSMMGDPASEVNKGIIPRAFGHIFNLIQSSAQKNFLIRCSFIEIYNEEIHDLLSRDPRARMELKEAQDKGVFIKDLTMSVVRSIPEMERLMNLGNSSRSVGETAMNKESSRSHSVFTIYIEVSEPNPTTGEDRITAGKLNLVDLAGSERQSKTGATGDRLKEANKINLSLTALGNVISALVDGKTAHVPYRDSKLTRLLQDSLGGNTKTVMVAAVSPADYNYDETLSTLRYASRAKQIKNKPRINEDPKDALIRQFADEIKKLKELLEASKRGGNIDWDALQGSGQLPNVAEKKNWEGEAEDLTKSGKHSKTKVKRLEEDVTTLNRDRERMEGELRAREELLNSEKSKREQLEAMLKGMEQRMLVGGQGDEDQKRKFKELQVKLKKEKKKQEALMAEKSRKEEEMLLKEKEYQSLQEEVEEQRKLLKNCLLYTSPSPRDS
eukprot:TRINITY_DN9646_c0_g1_i3.p1 TRINITY_DN9646_c0_g1~~TRINITY_DN9646_c0_g1_i3.p1  ORF type:complete len:537 (-),score=149.90 TRINITY_DN9646_c0_g1_i3:26-1636(-)